MPLDTLAHVHDGRARSALLNLPKHPALAILLLHPAASSGKAAFHQGGWSDWPDVAVCAPDGLPLNPAAPMHPVRNPRGWSSCEPPVIGRTVDDLGYLMELTRDFIAKLPEGTPVCVVGHSNGCAMGFQLLAEANHPFAGAVLYAAAWFNPVQCVRRVPLLYMAGESDPIYPWPEPRRVVTPWFSMHTKRVSDTKRAWLRATGLGDEIPHGPERNDYGLRTTWANDAGNVFEFQVLREQGHHWPTARPIPAQLEQILGPNNVELCATTLAVSFLRRHVGATISA